MTPTYEISAVISCVNCRRKKVKCDRQQPCSACQKSGLICVPAAKARASKSKKTEMRARNSELQSRLDRLESLFEKFEGLPAPLVEPVDERPPQDLSKMGSLPTSDVIAGSLQPLPVSTSARDNSTQALPSLKDPKATSRIEAHPYMGADFWASLSSEVSWHFQHASRLIRSFIWSLTKHPG